MLLLAVMGSAWADEVTLTNANIVSAGTGANGYKSWSITDGNNKRWNAYAIKNQHSNATSSYHYLQIKKYASNTAYYIQVPEYGTKITSITMTVSSTNQPMTGGGNSATLYFSSSNTTSAGGTGVASGTGSSSVTIDCSSLDLNTGFITAGGAVRIWDIKVVYENGSQTTTVATPIISPNGGNFSTPQENVTISCSTTGATIYYTTDGSDPKTSNTRIQYNSLNPISVAKTTTIKAYAEKDGVKSDVAETKYTLKVATPYINTSKAPEVAIHCSGTPDATIYYTTDESDPATSNTRVPYTGSFTLTKTTTIRACAEYGEMDRSDEADSKTVTLKTGNPTFSPEGGTYTSAQSVTISCANEGATIYYTLDGSDPTTTNSSVYSEPISVSETTTIKAMAVYGEYDESDVVTAIYTIIEISGDVFVKATSESELSEGMEIIIVNEDAKKTFGEQKSNNFYTVGVALEAGTAVPNEGATIMTLEGSAGAWYFNTDNGYLYAAGGTSNNYLRTQSGKNDDAKATISFDDGNAIIKFQGTSTHNIIRYNPNTSGNPLFSCYASGGQQPVQIYYRSSASSVVAPTITPATGTYTEPQTVTITNNAEGTTVYYTVDGTTPTSESSEFTAPFQLNKNGIYVVKAISIGDDGSSNVTTSTITINITVGAPEFEETAGTSFDAPYTIHLSAGEGTTIYYTTNNTSPIDANGNLTSDAVVYNSTTGIANLNKAITINAVAIDRFGNVSEISTASYYYEGEVTLPYYENFDQGLGNFTTEPSSNVKWVFQTNHNVEVYGEERKYAFITGGNYDTKSQYAGEDRLISPVFDLTNNENVTMSFIHTGHWFSNSPTGGDGSDGEEALMKASCHLQIRTVGDNGYSNWVDISNRIINWFTQRYRYEDGKYKGMFDRVNSGDIDLSDYKGQKIQICFYFTTTSSTSGTWNVLKFAVTGTEEEEPVNYETVNMKTDGYITYVVKNDIDWSETMKMNNKVYGYKVIQFTEATNGGTTVLVELGNDEEMAVDETKLEEALTTEQKKPLWSEKIIPAGTPIILKGKAGDNLLVIAKSDDVIPSVKGNLLKPSFGDVQGSGAQTLYVLQKSPEWVATNPYENYMFYKLANGRTIPERKAYLNGTDASEEIIYYLTNKPGADQPGPEGPSDAKANFVILAHTEAEDLVSEDAGLVDGINEVNGGNRMNDNEYYSISGVKVSNPSKGIYILNGKKVIVK